MNIRSSFFFLVFFVMCSTLPIIDAYAQKTEYPNYTFTPDEKIENLVTRALKPKIDAFYKEFQYIPYLNYATFDLNGDGKPEILAQFTEEMDYIDEKGNTDTHIFAYTTKGLIEIFQAKTSGVAIGKKDGSGLREIIAFKNPKKSKYDVYKWDGKRRYVKK